MKLQTLLLHPRHRHFSHVQYPTYGMPPRMRQASEPLVQTTLPLWPDRFFPTRFDLGGELRLLDPCNSFLPLQRAVQQALDSYQRLTRHRVCPTKKYLQEPIPSPLREPTSLRPLLRRVRPQSQAWPLRLQFEVAASSCRANL